MESSQPFSDSTLSLPLRIRLSLWLALGSALRLPVDALFASIDMQMTAARRQLPGRRLPQPIAERLRLAGLAKQLPGRLRDLIAWIVRPESLIRWLKRYQERQANSGERKKTGRPWIGKEKVDAILAIYDAGITSLKRIVGEMEKCGLGVAKSTVRRVLTRHGRPPDAPAPRRSTWAQFWNRHAPYLVGVDFIQIPIGLFGKIVNAFVLIGVEHDTRRAHCLGITTQPTDAWTANVLRAATMDGEPLANRRHWILDNDDKYGVQVRRVLGKRLRRTGIRAPDMNAIAERFIRSIREECLDHVVFLSEDMLRDYVQTYIRHYNQERPHQGIGNRPIGEWQVGNGEFVCDEHLHGLLKSFRCAA